MGPAGPPTRPLQTSTDRRDPGHGPARWSGRRDQPGMSCSTRGRVPLESRLYHLCVAFGISVSDLRGEGQLFREGVLTAFSLPWARDHGTSGSQSRITYFRRLLLAVVGLQLAVAHRCFRCGVTPKQFIRENGLSHSSPDRARVDSPHVGGHGAPGLATILAFLSGLSSGSSPYIGAGSNPNRKACRGTSHWPSSAGEVAGKSQRELGTGLGLWWTNLACRCCLGHRLVSVQAALGVFSGDCFSM